MMLARGRDAMEIPEVEGEGDSVWAVEEALAEALTGGLTLHFLILVLHVCDLPEMIIHHPGPVEHQKNVKMAKVRGRVGKGRGNIPSGVFPSAQLRVSDWGRGGAGAQA